MLPDGIGYGNLSCRAGGTDQFWITGSGTGASRSLGREGYSLVEQAWIDENRVRCRGPIAASSESMTHAAAYAADPDLKAVIHVHHRTLFLWGLNRLPSTPTNATYGTVAMARAVGGLVALEAGTGARLFALGGHADGLLACGPSLDDTGALLLHALEAARHTETVTADSKSVIS